MARWILRYRKKEYAAKTAVVKAKMTAKEMAAAEPEAPISDEEPEIDRLALSNLGRMLLM